MISLSVAAVGKLGFGGMPRLELGAELFPGKPCLGNFGTNGIWPIRSGKPIIRYMKQYEATPRNSQAALRVRNRPIADVPSKVTKIFHTWVCSVRPSKYPEIIPHVMTRQAALK